MKLIIIILIFFLKNKMKTEINIYEKKWVFCCSNMYNYRVHKL